ncbi:MAG TPA: ABC transporter permease subunit, partial [Stellaceae bacterium]|nr:ABC transporter permease subunit [Stellaceae bacterium]
MNYTFQFGVALAQLPELLKGAILTFELGLLTFWGGALIGLLGASLKTFGGTFLRGIANAYVIFFTNTPALIQIYFLYFGLPEFGIRWDNFTCVLIGLTLNAGAYLTEIMRAGFISVHRTE